MDPPQPVEVRRDDTWHPGWLQAWWRVNDGWRAFVRYTVGIGRQHVEWISEADLRAIS
jgi:hypothetical protein